MRDKTSDGCACSTWVVSKFLQVFQTDGNVCTRYQYLKISLKEWRKEFLTLYDHNICWLLLLILSDTQLIDLCLDTCALSHIFSINLSMCVCPGNLLPEFPADQTFAATPGWPRWPDPVERPGSVLGSVCSDGNRPLNGCRLSCWLWLPGCPFPLVWAQPPGKRQIDGSVTGTVSLGSVII